MKIYLAGNTPGRQYQEADLVRKGLSRRRLTSFYFLATDVTVMKTFEVWKDAKQGRPIS